MRARQPVFLFVLTLGFFEGAIYNFLPISFPAFQPQFGVTLEQLGRIPLVFFVSSILFSLSGGWGIARLGLRRAAIGVLALAVCAFLTIASAWSFAIIIGGACLFGLAVIAMEVLSAAIISDLLGDERQSNFFIWSISNAIGATAGPVVLGAFLRRLNTNPESWRLAYYTSASFAAIFLLWPLFARTGWKMRPEQSVGVSKPDGSLASILREKTIFALGFAIFLHGVSQVGMLSWIGQLYLHRFPIDAEHAAYLISFNSAGFFVGRSLMTWITRRWKIPELTLLAVCAGGSSLAFAITIAAPSYLAGLLAFTVAGSMVSGNGPCINSYTGLRFAGRVATSFAVMNGFGNIGSATGPYLIGLIGNHFGLEKGIWFLPCFSLALAGFAGLWHLAEIRQIRVPDTKADAQPSHLL